MLLKKPLLFLVVSISLLLYPAVGMSGQLGQWTTVNNLNVGRYFNVGVLAYDTIIFTLCGYSDYTVPLPVEKSVIKPDGYLTDWAIDSQTMNIARCSPAGFYYNGYIYALSGSDLVNYIGQCTTVERAKVNADGSLGKWEYINPILKGVMEASLILKPPYIYIIGGWNSTNEYSNEILRGKIQSDGNISEWTISTSSLLEGVNCPSSILIDSTIYVVSGCYTRNIESARICSDGELSAFTYAGVTKSTHGYPALLYDGKHINIIGGQIGGNFEYRGERVLINSDGSLGVPEIAPGLQYETGGFGYIQASTGGYVIGGDMSNVQFAPFLPPAGIENKYWELLQDIQ